MKTRVYREYDQEGLDREYDNRTKSPGFDFDGFLKWCAAESERARRDVRCALDVAYGPSDAETLDVFMPPGAKAGRRVDVFFHGGYWRLLHKNDFSYVANGLVPHDTISVIVNYALMPSVTMDQLIGQCRAALRWIHAHIAEYGGDPSRISISGHSAGAQMVTMMLATDWPAYAPEMPASPFLAAAAISGIYDLEPIRLSFLNKTLALDETTARHNSPLLLTPTQRCPLWISLGEREGDEYLRQADTLADAWRGYGVPVDLTVEAGHDHFTIRAELGKPDSPLIGRIVAAR